MAERLAWTVQEAADALGVPKSQIYALIKKGQLPILQIGKHYQIPDHVLREFIKDHTATTAA